MFNGIKSIKANACTTHSNQMTIVGMIAFNMKWIEINGRHKCQRNRLLGRTRDKHDLKID